MAADRSGGEGSDLDIEALVQTVLEAAEDSVIRYQQVSGGKTVHDHAIETFVSSKIAEAIYDGRKGVSLTVALEAPFLEVHELSGARKGKLPPILSPAARFDVCCYLEGRPVAVIEVKKRFAAFKAEADMRRLVAAVERFGPGNGGSMQAGIWVAVQRVAAGSSRTADQQIGEFLSSFTWDAEPDIAYRELEGCFGSFRRSGRELNKLRVFAAAFRP